MAWHKIGNSYYSDAERRAQSTTLFHFLVDVCLPGFIAYSGANALSSFLERHYQFFVVHTTMAKLLYIFVGTCIFGIVYRFRRHLIMMAFLTFIGLIVLGVTAQFLSWLFK